MKTFLRKIFPRGWIEFYHKLWAMAAAFCYGFPSRKLKVIGVTGTDGKSTTCHLIAKVLEGAGYKVGEVSTVYFKIASEEWINKTRLTMLGRFGEQKMLAKMVQAGCDYAVIESSSEGLAQWRHWGIDYRVAVLTNLTGDHLEAHGGFLNYRAAKGRLFAALAKTRKYHQEVKTISVVNLQEKEAEFFLKFPADEKYGYQIKNHEPNYSSNDHLKRIFASGIELTSGGVKFKVNNEEFQLKLLGEFNIENALAAICVGLSQGIDLKNIKNSLSQVNLIPGRLEKINEGQNFQVIVDYAHTPDSFEKIFTTLKKFYSGNDFIVVFGSAGGVRDKSKAPKLGASADKYAAKIILTNEDPYDTPPLDILKWIESGITSGKKLGEDYWLIEDRREAIRQAFRIAKPNDLVLILGKGTEPCIKIDHQKIPWDDRTVAKEELYDLSPHSQNTPF